jgi:hypothetical protein
MIPVEAMPPLMFGGLVLFMLIGYPVSFSLAALGFFFGFIAIEHGFFGLNYCRRYPAGSSATFFRTTCSWRYRSSRSWVLCSNGAVLPKTCSTRWDSSLGQFAVASGIP